MSSPTADWYPIGRSDDAAPRHTMHSMLLGQELAVWRADDGHVNVWDNLCLHRGVRLSIGHNEGNELKCAYHGWRYSNRTGGCTYIPAHPANAPAQRMCARVFASFESNGLIWASLESTEAPPELTAGGGFPLRSLPINAAAEVVIGEMANYCFRPSSDLDRPGQNCEALSNGGRVSVTTTTKDASAGDIETVHLFVQPVDSGHCVVHGFLTAAPEEDERIAVLRHHADELGRIRRSVEATTPAPPTSDPAERPTPGERTGRGNDLIEVVIERKYMVAEEIVALELKPVGGPLPAAQPGAHIDLYLPDGTFRQYSLVNQSGGPETYLIGVKLEPDSRGGSLWVHEAARPGDRLNISAPKNNFALRRDSSSTLLLAGGIGITPLLSMATTLMADRLPFELHYFTRTKAHLAFVDRLDELGDSATRHLGLDADETGGVLSELLSQPGFANRVYACGPGPFLEAVGRLAKASDWPDENVHFEYFANTSEIDRTGGFSIELARSGLSLEVKAGESILDVLRANGIPLASSCEQGACGSCAVTVIEGQPIHQDVFLDPADRASGTAIVTCVSRSDGRLVLDI